MASTPVQRKVTPIDPMFPIPAGVDELVYSTHSEIDSLRETVGPVDSYTGSPVDPSIGSPIAQPGQTTVATPSVIGVVSQQVRRAPSGENVIDVVVAVDDVAGATKYEFRVTKI